MRDIPQHATMQQMREASHKLTYAAQRMGLDPLPVQSPWPARVWQVQRSMAGLPFSYMVQDNRSTIEPQPVHNMPRWQSFKQWLGVTCARYNTPRHGPIFARGAGCVIAATVARLKTVINQWVRLFP